MDAMSTEPAYYESLINGRLGPECVSWFEGMTAPLTSSLCPLKPGSRARCACTALSVACVTWGSTLISVVRLPPARRG